MSTRTLVTCALPYANGPVHLGHMVEHVQTDIYVRFLRSRGDDVVFLCADDTHGAPIELNALKQGVTPETFVARWAVEHQRDFADFDISFDHYGSTNSPENRYYAELIYTRAKDAGSIVRKEVEQPYDEKSKRWLSDRFIRGTCPNCGAADQYGDACEKCSATYTPRDLLDARSAISGEPLTWKKSSHLFFALSKHEAFLRAQLAKPGFTHPGPAAQLGQFFDKGLADWDITRDGPYFGFPIPGEDNKYFYVWLDAPIGYIAATEQWAKKTGKANDALELWDESRHTRIVHVIGKDIVYFHCLFWPAVLHVAKLKLPEYVHVHGHLTVNGEKLSKSRGTFINVRPYLDLLDASYLRFYYASLLGPGPEDLDLNLTEFRQRVNAELVNNLGNLANRTLSLLARPELGKRLAPSRPELGQALVEKALSRVPEIAAAFGSFDHRTAVKAILEVGYAANQFLTQHEPWKAVKTDLEGARAVLSEAAEIVYLLTALIDPIVPRLAGKLAAQLGRHPLTFKALQGATYPLLDRSVPIGEPSPLINRLDEAQVARLITGPADAAARPVAAAPVKKNKQEPKAPVAPPAEIEYDDFAKVQLKVGRVLAAEKVERADKLLKLTVDLGEGAPRTIVSGIAEAYAPETVTGRNVVVVANLKPRALRGIESRGMILTAGSGGKDLLLIDPGDAPPGADVK
jgi:methionyl-tRNA synthetase